MPDKDPTFAFIDTETTGLDETIQEMFELAVIMKIRDAESGDWIGEEERVHWMFGPTNLKDASPDALRISNFHARTEEVGLISGGACDLLSDEPVILTSADAVHELAGKLNGVHLVGANPAFDARFIASFFRQHGYGTPWHHRMIDIESMVFLGSSLIAPIGLQAIAEEMGIDPGAAHTAMSDAETTLAVFNELMLSPTSANP